MNNCIRNPKIKQAILDYVQKTTNAVRCNYVMINTERDLEHLNKKGLLVSPNYGGTGAFLVFVRLHRSKLFSVIIDKKSIGPNINKVRMIMVRIRLNNSIYNGSILDGTLLRTPDAGQLFIVNDIYALNGQRLVNDFMVNKFINITTFLKHNYVEDNVLNNIKIIVNDLHDVSQTRKLVKDTIPNLKYSKNVKGLIFLPETSGTRLIYLFQIHKPKNKAITKNSVAIANTETKHVNFRMTKTKIPDVYKLYLLNTSDDKKYKKIDIAYLPTLESSKLCKSLYNDGEKHKIVMCEYVNDKQKWLPIRLSDQDAPDNENVLI